MRSRDPWCARVELLDGCCELPQHDKKTAWQAAVSAAAAHAKRSSSRTRKRVRNFLHKFGELPRRESVFGPLVAFLPLVWMSISMGLISDELISVQSFMSNTTENRLICRFNSCMAVLPPPPSQIHIQVCLSFRSSASPLLHRYLPDELNDVPATALFSGPHPSSSRLNFGCFESNKWYAFPFSCCLNSI